MKIKSSIYVSFLAAILCVSLSSCEDDDSPEKDIILLTGDVVNLGEVPAGSTGQGDFSVKGQSLTRPITLSIAGEDFSIGRFYQLGTTNDVNIQTSDFGESVLFAAANIVNNGRVLFMPDRSDRGPVSTTVDITTEGISKTLQVTANVVEPLPLEEGTVVYANGFEFGIEDGTAVGNGEIGIDQQTDPSVIAISTVALSTDPDNLGQERDLRSDDDFARCPDNTFDPPCGDVLELRRVGTTLNIELLGLEPGRTFTITYYVLPGGNSSRGLNVTVTGDTSPIFDDLGGLGGRSAGYQEFTRTGIPDENGRLNINIVYTNDGTNSGGGRSLAFDDISVVAGPIP